MAKAVADSDVDNQGGFAADSNHITGFSHMHDSGTGGVSLLQTNELVNSTIENCSIRLSRIRADSVVERLFGEFPTFPLLELSG
jgi:putative alpha-1,2-mannosidase